MDSFIRDIRFAVRGLMKKPAFTLIAVLTLALGIGANSAIFSVVNAVLLRPLAVKDPDRLMTFWHSAPAKGLKHLDLNDALFAYYRDRTRTFESLAAHETGSFSITGGGEPEVVPGAIVTFNYFEVLGREPLYGRVFTPQEDTPGNNHVALLSYALWQRRFWEHTIRNEEDFTKHVDYIHYNPIKHRLVSRVRDWPHSSFHRYVRLGVLPVDWAGDVNGPSGGFGERR